eukprot:23927-Chlamydomonas_euryale.AAC.1
MGEVWGGITVAMALLCSSMHPVPDGPMGALCVALPTHALALCVVLALSCALRAADLPTHRDADWPSAAHRRGQGEGSGRKALRSQNGAGRVAAARILYTLRVCCVADTHKNDQLLAARGTRPGW